MLEALLLLSLAAAAESAPPVAPVRVVEETLHGVTLRDPYRWLEDVNNAETKAWMKAHADHARATLDALPGRAALRERLGVLDRAITARAGNVVVTSSGDIFFTRRKAGEEVAKLFVRRGWGGTDRLLFDPDSLRKETGKPHAISWFSASPDGRRVAIGVAASGSEKQVLSVYDTKSGKLVEGPIERVKFGAPTWLPDGRSMVYTRLRPGSEDGPAAERWLDSQAWLHRVGEPEASDKLVFGTQFAQKLPIAAEDAPVVTIVAASPWAVAAKTVASATQGFFVAPVAALGSKELEWTKLYDYADDVRYLQARGDLAYALVMKGSANGRIVERALTGKRGERVLYEGRTPIDAFGVAKDGIYFRERDGVYERLLRLGFDGGTPEEIDFGLRGSFVPSGGDTFSPLGTPDADGIVVAHGTWTRTDLVMRTEPGTRAAKDTGLMPLAKGIAPDGYVAEDLVATSHDGTKVPMSLVRPRAAKRDGTNRVLLEAYGSYGISVTPYFDPTFAAWLDNGVSRATCHVRGGGELGDAWHRGGFHATKANTWKDFIACAERLVELGYTKSALLAGTGTSAGGITIGNAIVERPELFGAAIANVGALDVLRAIVASQNGPGHYAEFGDTRTKDGWTVAHAMSAYWKLRDDTAYPPTLIVHGVNDSRVDVWQSTKFGARLAAATTRGPVLMRLDYEQGHGIGSARSAALDTEADRLAFVLWQTGAKARP